MRRRVLAAPIAALSAAALGLALAGPADAGQANSGTEVIGGLIAPLSVAVDNDGTIYVSQNFAGMLTKKAPDGDPHTIFTAANGGEVGAVSVEDGVVTFGTTVSGAIQQGRLWQKAGNAPAALLLNTTKYETKHNPDGATKYGVFRISKSCRAKAPKKLGKYFGQVDSHPYASDMDGDTTYLADAGGNDILKVTDAGASTVAVLPPTRIKITSERQKALGLPRCARDSVLRVEAVPTDVEVGPDGKLYVTSLPGGPEDESLGANGRVYKVDPATGDVTKMAGGLVSPTGIGIAPNGTAFVSLLFPGLVLAAPLNGSPGLFAQVPFPGDVDWANGKLYVVRSDLTNDGTSPPNGAVLEFDAPVVS